jgi:uncharacterized protein YecE (DUF72 family)
MSSTTFHVGTSGYSYKEWKGSFYPKDLPAKEMLEYYSEHFRAVEINGTFYRMPTAAAVSAWADQVPADFRFIIKAPQRITHFQRLRASDESTSQLLEVAGVLKKRLGPLLFQLPGNFKKDVPRLREYLSLLPAKQRVTFEFRHESWFDQEVFDLLSKHKIALCVAEAEDLPKTPFVSTADWGYFRLRMAEYSDADLKRWIKRAREQKLRDVFVFFKHEDEGKGPMFARRFLELAKQAR